ncbi:FAD-dependent oxidoreductase [Pelagicoccus albus]|uniref:FAD-dependent oxidoreductase n=1 Tax=Pelagicoccus albus TaxID=415222 RepID=A0A7X1B3D1_9BACT|nr:FAD-dependent oxidoreductase [Pelagicoccus albus]MBC2604842.1 FAD-dependent oxidoreductase [Pelagicoccus albus]
MPNLPSNPESYDAIVFGGGLAGSILAEQLIARGLEILLVDNANRSQCSRVAAGLINPIGGKRLKRVWMADELIPFATSYYQKLESQHGTRLFHPRPLHRYFSNPDEAKLWTKRLQEKGYAESTTALPEQQSYPCDSHGGFAIPKAGYLDTNSLLELIHSQLTNENHLLSSTFHYNEIEASESPIYFRGRRAKVAIFAEGHLATGNPHFEFIPYKPAKGIIARIRLTQAPEANSPILLKGKFLVPRHDGTLQIGATYNWDDPNDTPDEEGIAELAEFLDREFGADSWEFEEIRAGVRPATAGAYPVVGPHPNNSRIIAFNGFGSKGSMQIPYFSAALADFLQNGKSLQPEVLPSRFIKKETKRAKRWLATNVAKDAVLQRLKAGDTAIDATAGNGHDTQWLAEQVGKAGHVFAYDIQEQAIKTTRTRLEKHGLSQQATLFQAGHENLLVTIPSELHGKISAIVFNLGFLPGGDEKLITLPKTTLSALDQSIQLLQTGGILSVTLYPSHPGASDEVDQVLAWLNGLSTDEFEIRIERHPTGNQKSPYPFFVIRK